VLICLDWDGTVTEVDSLHMVLHEFGDHDAFRRHEGALGAKLTLHEVLAAEFVTVTAPLDEVVAWLLEHVRLRRGFAEFAARRRPVIVSAGFHELIEPVLSRAGLGDLEVRANRIDARASGWRTRFRDPTPCVVCGEPCKRRAVAERPFLYVGDGYSDRCVALASDRVFARAGLATYLEARGVAHEPFLDFVALEARLDDDTALPQALPYAR
jgi:2-hydroxy-3-keto-5-methylthiopentenyl-1-phosphate phosphatase